MEKSIQQQSFKSKTMFLVSFLNTSQLRIENSDKITEQIKTTIFLYMSQYLQEIHHTKVCIIGISLHFY